MTLKAEKFEEMLAGELQRELEPQRGKALAAFRAQIAEEAQRPQVAGTIRPGRDISRGEMWFWASVPSLAAACLAVVVTLKLLGGAGATPTVTPTPSNSSMAGGTAPMSAPAGVPQVILVSKLEQHKEVTPNRRREETQWVDPNEGSKYKLTSDEQYAPIRQPAPGTF